MSLKVIAAAVIGGCSLSGGRGSIMAGLLGLVLMNVLTNAAILLHVSPYWQKALIGSVLLIAIATEVVGRKHSVANSATNGG
jgi:ribose/xylose/arabinose/galactoside ABC-type transport system permease subunit